MKHSISMLGDISNWQILSIGDIWLPEYLFSRAISSPVDRKTWLNVGGREEFSVEFFRNIIFIIIHTFK